MNGDDGSERPRKSMQYYVNLAVFAVLGSGIFVDDIVACEPRQATHGTGMGPHYVANVPAANELWRAGDPGQPLFLRSRVIDTCGQPISGAQVQLWHANQDGEHAHDRWRTRLTVGDQGTFSVVTVMPGYAGGIAKHIHFIVSHPDYEELVTRLFFKDDPYIDGAGVNDLALWLEQSNRNGQQGFVAGYEFVLAPRGSD